MNTKRSKRWNGSVDTLTADYLKEVMVHMSSYGERVQFSLITPGARPSYQVTNAYDKKMAFNGNHHLTQPQEDEFTGSNASPVLTLEQLKAAIAGIGVKKTAGTRAVRTARAASPRSSTVAARAEEQLDVQKYEYFRNNIQTLPEGIRAYSEDITELMKKGMSAEEAFGEIVQQHF